MATISEVNSLTQTSQHLLMYLFHDTGTIHVSIKGTQVLASIAEGIIRLSVVNPSPHSLPTNNGVPLHRVNSEISMGEHEIT